MYQAQMAAYLALIYSAQLGIEVPEGTIQRRFQPPPAGASQAVNDLEAAMSYCRDEILPQLDDIDRDVIRPALELQVVVKTIQKSMVKRNHKLLDYDRHRTSHARLQAKNTKSFNEEKQLLKLESQLAAATADYEYLNNLLKTQLPQFFYLKTKFIEPVIGRFYDLQCKIYGMIYARHHEVITANSQHFMTNAMPIVDGFNWRQAQHDMRAEYENLDLLKAGGKAWLSASGGSTNSKLSLQERANLKQMERMSVVGAASVSSGPGTMISGADNGTVTLAKPHLLDPVGQVDDYSAGLYSLTLVDNNNNDNSKDNEDDCPPMQPPSPVLDYHPSIITAPIMTSVPGGMVDTKEVGSQHVIALYDYEAQAQGDLSFQKDDLIQVISRTSNANDWWTGHLRGVTGIFPGNYVRDN
ncbi:hypothetical protein J3Q64DRAFT_1706882 [Phycomyces blakesleeanus]